MNYDNCCPICFNDFDLDICGNLVNIAITKCNHKFCLPCIIHHSRSKYTCPLCRGEFISPNSTSFSLFEQDNEDNIIQRELEIASNIQRDMEVNSWYFGNNQEPIMPHINISYDASNVTFSYRDNINIQTNENNNMHLYHLERSIYDMAMSIESSENDESEIQDMSSNSRFTTL